MKVLFAVSNEGISESIVKKYQKEYKQIISYKNVYYFNAIAKELQKDKSYDRIVISEDLEAFTNNQYDQIDKFIFEKLDAISDEATDLKGNDTPIILICSDRRNKSEQMLIKIFGIGIYNAIIGSDRSIDEVCRLINRPRTKKEAKLYYKIDAENVNYQTESENDVSEMEIQNILAHYRRLGKNEERYVDSFNNIAAQYNDTQLRIISKFLPLNVRAVLEEKSTKYQQVMSFNNSVSDNLRRPDKQETEGPSGVLLKSKSVNNLRTGPVIIPSSMNANNGRKLSKIKSPSTEDTPHTHQNVSKEETIPEYQNFDNILSDNDNVLEEINKFESVPSEKEQTDKKGRGRPRKNPIQQEEQEDKMKRGRGRPRKNTLQEDDEDILSDLLPLGDDDEISNDNVLLPGMEDDITDEDNEEELLSGLTEITDDYSKNEYDDDILPGLSGESQQYDNFNDEDEIFSELPDSTKNKPEDYKQNVNVSDFGKNNYYTNNSTYNNESYFNKPNEQQLSNNDVHSEYESIDLSYLLTPDKKIITFVGTSKNGTSFIVNNLAELISSMGINTAILDTTENRNSYYIYTKNEEELRKIAAQSIDGLSRGICTGIPINNNLTVYTSLPSEGEGIRNVDKVLETLLKRHSLILIDSDFNTPSNYFKQSQETYLVQSLDVLTIQPLTAFLRDLKAKNILEEKKLRVILNKAVKLRGVNEKTIIGGMAYYNDPAMSYMTELFDRNMIKYISIPFEEETYIRYLEGIIECNISLKGYSKVFMQTLRELANMAYKNTTPYTNGINQNYGINNTFSATMNNTLNQMKNKY